MGEHGERILFRTWVLIVCVFVHTSMTSTTTTPEPTSHNPTTTKQPTSSISSDSTTTTKAPKDTTTQNPTTKKQPISPISSDSTTTTIAPKDTTTQNPTTTKQPTSSISSDSTTTTTAPKDTTTQNPTTTKQPISPISSDSTTTTAAPKDTTTQNPTTTKQPISPISSDSIATTTEPKDTPTQNPTTTKQPTSPISSDSTATTTAPKDTTIQNPTTKQPTSSISSDSTATTTPPKDTPTQNPTTKQPTSSISSDSTATTTAPKDTPTQNPTTKQPTSSISSDSTATTTSPKDTPTQNPTTKQPTSSISSDSTATTTAPKDTTTQNSTTKQPTSSISSDSTATTTAPKDTPTQNPTTKQPTSSISSDSTATTTAPKDTTTQNPTTKQPISPISSDSTATTIAPKDTTTQNQTTTKKPISPISSDSTATTTAPKDTSTKSPTTTQPTSQTTSGATATTTENSTKTTTPAPDYCNPDPCINGTCNATEDGYICECTQGFTDRNCSTDIDICPGVTCKNGGTCVDLPDGYTCKCVPGFTGKDCETDIVDCEGVTCGNGGTCVDLVNGYNCTCVPGWTGENCTTDVDECKENDCQNGGTCNNLFNSFTCTCVVGFTGHLCDININDCVNVTCDNGGTCKDSVNDYTCECAVGWEGTHCETDIDECVDQRDNDCHVRANCTNTDGSYNCTCNKGFEGNGKDCSDINECEDDTANCTANNTRVCFNMVASFRCVCNRGWTGVRCETDIDECTNSSLNDCGANAVCYNTDGHYRCQCEDGFRGNGSTCVAEVLFPVQPGAEDFTGDDEVYGPFTVPGGLPYQQQLYYNIYVSMNGYITLNRAYRARYPPQSSRDWESSGVPIIAPFWSDIETRSPSGLYINSDIKNTTYLEDFVLQSKGDLTNPRFGFMATWKKAVPYPYDQNKNVESADFQALIVTNGSSTLVIFNYDHVIYTWDASGIGRYINIGFSEISLQGKVVFNQNNFSEANKKGNEGLAGRWVFDVSTSKSESVVTEAKCQQWLSDEDIQDQLKWAQSRSEPCPCSYWQAIRDSRFRYYSYEQIDKNYLYVFKARFYRSPYANRQKCHYNWRGSLERGHPDGGYLETYSDNLQIEQAYKECCDASKRLCKKFYKANPSDNCRRYRPRPWRPTWGDPHFTTLDGKEYTFNGRGEYILLQYNDTTIQTRTELANSSSTDATIFVGLAAKNAGGDIIEIALNSTTATCTIYVNGVVNATFSSVTPDDWSIDANGTSVYKVSNTSEPSLVVALETGVSVQVTVTNILDFVTSVPSDAAGQTSGLLGNFDGDATNDFIMRNGTTMSADSTEERLFQFGKSWNIRDENESLFKYTIAGKDFSYYNNDTIKPAYFVGDLVGNLTAYLTERCSGSLTEESVRDTCGENTACIIDTAATCSSTFGERSKETQETVEEEAAVLENEPPMFYNDDIINVRPGLNATVVLHVNDTNSFTISHDTDIAKFTFNDNEFVWNVGEDEVYLRFTATDNLNATREYWPNIYHCACNQISECDYSEIDDTSNENRFYRAKCNCTEGMKGDYCNETVDLCDPFPCFEGVTCNSSNPESLCGACPDGYEGDGTRCWDENECVSGTSGCSQVCTNTLGSYTCSCRSGFTLNKDNHTCDDIDECHIGTDSCTAGQACLNVPGSFECQCKPGYIASTDTECVKVQVTLIMKLVVKIMQEDVDKIQGAIDPWVRNVFTDTFFTSINVKLDLMTTRRRREAALQQYNLTVMLHPQDGTLTAAKLQEKFDTYKQDVGVNVETPNIGIPIQIILNESKVLNDDDVALCEDSSLNPCDPLSTECSVANSRPVCTCKTGFEEWLVAGISCKDIDECRNASSICMGGDCSNTLGSYRCKCQPGFRYDGTSQCQDLCQPSPCQNDGECIHGNEEEQYICKCDDKWAGVNCERENEETKKLRTIAIVVGAVIGGVCLLLVLALFGVWRRSMRRKQGYKRQVTGSCDLDNVFQPSHPNLNRDKDLPFDDDNTTFTIPRPKLGHTNHMMTDLDAQSNGSSQEQYAKASGERDSVATKPLTAESSSSGERLSGKVNQSFLHDESKANLRQSQVRAKSSNPYEYF